MQKIVSGEGMFMNRRVHNFIAFFFLLFCTLSFAQNRENVEGKRVSIRFYTKSVIIPVVKGVSLFL